MPTSSLPTLLTFESVSLTTAFGWVLVAITLAFIIHFIVVSYHWYTFGTERVVSLLSIIIYGGVGAVLLLAMTVTLFAI